MWIKYNPNPVRTDSVRDCSVRAISKALGISWEKAFMQLASNAFLMGDVISSDVVWGSLLRQNGFKRYVIPNDCPDCYTANDFCKEYPDGTYVIKMDEHVATVVDGNLYDSWDSGNEIVLYYWSKDNEQNQETDTNEQKG